MKKTIVFCLFCVIFTLIPVSICFAQPYDWSEWDLDDDSGTEEYLDPTLLNDDFNNSAASPSPAANFDSAPAPAPFTVDSSAETDKALKAAADAANSAKIAEDAAKQATEAAKQATEAAFAASAESAAVSAAAGSASPAASTSAPPPASPASPQPPVRIVIPMMTAPPAQYAPPAPPPPPPVQPAPPAYRQPSINVIPAMPSPYSNCLYRVQVGAFSNAGLAQQCFSRLLSAGFSPAYEPYGNVNRIVLPGIKAADVALVVQRLAAAGFNEVWIREER